MGNVGIGTDNPLSKLDVSGNIQISSAELPMGLITEVGGQTPLFNMSLNFREANRNNQYVGAAFRIDSRDHYSIFQWKCREPASHEESTLMELSRSGQLGIGTSDFENSKLAVNGTIRAKEIKVETNWADFVFEEGYQLMKLSELENFINENGHLPEIPTEEEVEENGISLGEMNSKLLQKVEELTLYIIDQNQSLDFEKKRNNQLQETQDQILQVLKSQNKEIEQLKKQLNQ
nr:hypothetical protein [uncultured Marinifilum sp.]